MKIRTGFSKGFIVCVSLLSLLLIPTLSTGAIFCVSNTTELQNALTTVESNGEDNTIKIVQGTYNGNFVYASTEGYSLSVEGGYTQGCASRTIDPANTILDGGGIDTVLALVSQTAANFSVEGLTLRNGNTSTVDNGGGLYAKNEKGSVTLTNNTFTENTASSRGGGAYVGGNGTLTNNTFTGNTSGGNGGGLSGSGTLTNNLFTENTSGIHGGGASVQNGTLTNNTFTENTANLDGGGAYVYGNITLTNNLFTENTSGASGGGVYGGGILTNNTFTGNTANIDGGGALVWAGSTLTNNTFTGNNANSYGGGAQVQGPSTLTNNLFTENTSGIHGGGVYGLGGGGFTLTNNTFSGNAAENQGGGIWITIMDDNHEGKLYNNIIWNNSASEASSLYLDNTGDEPFFPVPVQLYNNNLDQSAFGTYIAIPFSIDPSNLDNEDPLFVESGNYHLTASSPCIDVGDNDAPDLPGTDKDGNPRIVKGTVDMGAYEYNPSAPIADAGPDQTVDAGAPVTLDGFNSSDPESEPLTYLWTQIAGTIVALSDFTAVQPTFTAPETSLDGELIFQLAVTNSSGLKNTDWITVKVEWGGLIYIALDGQCDGNTPCYSKIQDGIDSAYDEAVIKMEQGIYWEDIFFDEPTVIIFQGGWDSAFESASGVTSVNSMTISDGTVILDEGCLTLGD